MAQHIPLSTLLSQAFIAFTIEFDNEWEWRCYGSEPPRLFRTSMVMWTNFMRFVDEKGTTLLEISRKAGYPPKKLHPATAGMIRWGYVTATPVKEKDKGKKPKLDWLVHRTAAGKVSAAIRENLAGEIEQRWVQHFGGNEVARLNEALRQLVEQFECALPHHFPQLTHLDGFRAVLPHEPECANIAERSLSTLLSQAIHTFCLDFEAGSELSLALRANFIRMLDEQGTPLKELPRLSGVSKEAWGMASKFLQKHGFAIVEAFPAGRGKQVGLTATGLAVRDEYDGAVATVEADWCERYGRDTVTNLREALLPLVVGDGCGAPPLFACLETQPTVWRAEVPAIEVLPASPLVLHRGGWPDGS